MVKPSNVTNFCRFTFNGNLTGFRAVLNEQINRMKISTKYYNILNAFGCVVLLLITGCKTQQHAATSSSFSYGLLEKDIEYLASDELAGRQIGEPGELLAAQFIASRMEALGLEPMGTDGFFQEFSVKDKSNPHKVNFTEGEEGQITGRNVIGLLDNKATNTVVIGAHFDHLGLGGFGSLHPEEGFIHNGADDNASGVAGMLWLAEKLKNTYKQNNYVFIAFSGEEYGLWGSNYFTKNPTIDLKKVNYMLNFDMIGRLKEEHKLAVNGVGTSPSWISAIEKISSANLEIVTSPGGIGASDHTSFYLQEIPVLHFFTGQHEDYHKPSDDEHLINYNGINLTLQFVLDLIEELEKVGRLEYTETKDADQRSRATFNVTLGVMPDYLYDGEGMRIDGVRSDRPAQKAGIIKGDVVIKMGDLEIKDMEAYMQALSHFQPGVKVVVVVRRGDEIVEAEVEF